MVLVYGSGIIKIQMEMSGSPEMWLNHIKISDLSIDVDVHESDFDTDFSSPLIVYFKTYPGLARIPGQLLTPRWGPELV